MVQTDDVSTMIDLAAIDVDSRQILFRAAATASSSDRDKIVKIRKKTNQAMNTDFATALSTLTIKVDQELYAFEERLKRIPPNIQNDNGITVKHRKGYSGSTGLIFCIMLVLLVLKRQRANKTNFI